MPTPSIQDQAYLKLGKLIHSYQKFEALLKIAVTRSDVFGEGKEIEENFKKLQAATSGQTLGSIANRLFETIYGLPKEVPEPEVIDQVFFHSALRIVIPDPEELARQRKKFQAVVEDRNTLIHQSLIKFNLESDTDCQSLIDEIDRQHKQLDPLSHEIQNLLKNHIDCILALKDNPELLTSQGNLPDSVEIGDLTFTKDSR